MMPSAPWAWLFVAGLVEVAFSQSIKPTQGFTRPLASVICLVLGAASIYLLTHAMQGIPVGTAYAVFTGLGAIGAVTLGVIIGDDPLTALRLGGLALIIVGVMACHAAETG